MSYGRTEANSKHNYFCFVDMNVSEKVILCYFAKYAYVTSKDKVKMLDLNNVGLLSMNMVVDKLVTVLLTLSGGYVRKIILL